MKVSKTLGKPENWQDFESLCKKLWGEIWKCSEIKKNGRSGQDQSGVDVYGIPHNDSEYYGIQCKGKDEYTHKQLTEKEIDIEIANAKNFVPALKKFYFATTANKDAKIESYIRTKDIENRKNGLFEIHLFCWEDIVDLINGNKETHDYYVNSINFKSNSSVEVTFDDESTELIITPKFRKTVTHYQQKIIPADSNYIDRHFANAFKKVASFEGHNSKKDEINYSYCSFALKIHNSGTSPIENYKLIFDFEGDVQDLSDTNEIENIKRVVSLIANNTLPNTRLNNQTKSGVVSSKEILVGDDDIKSIDIFIKPFPVEAKIIIHWKLLSKNFKDHGKLIIEVRPEIIDITKVELVEDPFEVRIEEIDEDFIKEIENN